MSQAATDRALLIKGGRVYDHEGDVGLPPVADVLIVAGKIAAVRAGVADADIGLNRYAADGRDEYGRKTR
jgi:hypothetical protein